jgi:hypothetical protein
MKQIDLMRALYHGYNGDRDRCIEEFAAAGERGEVPRVSNKDGGSARRYARALYKNYLRKGLF